MTSVAPAPAPADDRKVVLITGASSGIGLACARRFAVRGWRVWASMRRPDKGEPLRAEARERSWAVETPALDVTDDGSVAATVDGLLAATGGRLDLLINNAGYMALGPLEETSPDELRAQLETNLIGVHRVTRRALPAMRAAGRGRIVVISSISGLVALPILGAYQASKWALEGMTETLRYELSGFGIGVVLVEPGPFKTLLHDNELLSVSTGPDSPYAALVAAYERESGRLRRGELAQLIDVIERASTMRSPKLRWPVGPTSFSGAYLRRIAPDRIYELVVRRVFGIRRAR